MTTAITNAASQSVSAVQHGIVDAFFTLANGANAVANVIAHPSAQRQVLGQVSEGIDSLYGRISGGIKNANDAMEGKGEALLNKEISGMSQYTAKRLEITEEMTSGQKALRSTVNKMKDYHEAVIRNGEAISRTAGAAAHTIVSLALSPIRFVTKVLQIEGLGRLIQNAVALAVGFVVRGVILALSQLAHVLPYVGAAAAIAGVGVGLAALAIKVSPLAAVGAGIGLLLIGQQAQMAMLSKDVNKVAEQIRDAKNNTPSAKAGRFVSRGKTLLTSLVRGAANLTVAGGKAAYNHKGKIATAAALGATGAALYTYGVPTVVSSTAERAFNYLGSFFFAKAPEAIASKSPEVFAKVMGANSNVCPRLEDLNFDICEVPALFA